MRAFSPRCWPALRGWLVLAAVALPAGPGLDARAAEPAHCPSGSAPDPERTAAVIARLRAQQAGRRLLAELGREPVLCYGEVREGVLQDDGAVVLQRDRAWSANAARLGHLVQHLVLGLPFDGASAQRDGRPCDDVVRRAVRLERAAHQLENQLRRAYGLPPLPWQDPSGDYRRRCRALRPAPVRPSPR